MTRINPTGQHPTARTPSQRWNPIALCINARVRLRQLYAQGYDPALLDVTPNLRFYRRELELLWYELTWRPENDETGGAEGFPADAASLVASAAGAGFGGAGGLGGGATRGVYGEGGMEGPKLDSRSVAGSGGQRFDEQLRLVDEQPTFKTNEEEEAVFRLLAPRELASWSFAGLNLKLTPSFSI